MSGARETGCFFSKSSKIQSSKFVLRQLSGYDPATPNPAWGPEVLICISLVIFMVTDFMTVSLTAEFYFQVIHPELWLANQEPLFATHVYDVTIPLVPGKTTPTWMTHIQVQFTENV